jgi:phosphoglycerate dehydrogenase-like enzyme
MAMLCALARGFHHAWRLRAEGRLDRQVFDQYFDDMHDLEGETCLIVGLGDAGLRVAAACAALGMNVHGIKNRVTGRPAHVKRLGRLGELQEAAAVADYVVNLLPLTTETTGVFDANVLGAMKRSAFFINTGRGQTVDETALIGALESGAIAGAGLDVFSAEPLPASSPLWSLPNTIITPHVACLSINYWQRQIALFLDNLRLFQTRQPLINTIDPQLGY